MAGRELAYNLIDELTEEQFHAVMVVLQSMHRENHTPENETDKLDSIMGILHEYADPSKIPLEKTAWAEAAAEKHLKFLEEMKNENP